MKNKKVYLIGGSIVVLAVVIILLCVFVPIWSHRAEMKRLLPALQGSARMTVGDPLYENGDFLGNTGKEVLLEGERLTEIEGLLQAICDGGYRTDGTRKMSAGSSDLTLKVRSAEGEILILWFNDEHFYYIDGSVAVLFEAKDEAAFASLVEKMRAAVNEL